MTSLALNMPTAMPGGSFFSRFKLKQFMAVFLALATLTATMTVTSSDADARRRRGVATGLIAAGVIGGLALGAIAASSSARAHDGYYANDNYYRPRPRPRYVTYDRYADDGYYVQRRPICRIKSIRTYDDYGNVYRQRVRVCR